MYVCMYIYIYIYVYIHMCFMYISSSSPAFPRLLLKEGIIKCHNPGFLGFGLTQLIILLVEASSEATAHTFHILSYGTYPNYTSTHIIRPAAKGAARERRAPHHGPLRNGNWVHTCHILPPSEIDLGLCLALFAGSGGKYLFHRIG